MSVTVCRRNRRMAKRIANNGNADAFVERMARVSVTQKVRTDYAVDTGELRALRTMRHACDVSR